MPDHYPLISVRIPAYNHERYIEAALDSILVQDYPNKEIVIVDDGSTDGTAAVIDRWIAHNGDEIPIIFRTRENRGISRTINELIHLARGELLVGLASDDILLPGSLSVRYAYLRDHPEKMAVFGDSRVIGKDGEILLESGLCNLHSANKSEYTTYQGLKREIITNWSITGSVLMVRREVHELFLYDTGLPVEDRDFYLKLVSKDLLGFIDIPVSGYRVHGDNLCLDRMSRFHSSKNKFKALARNIHRFTWRDRILFLRPIMSSFFGMLVNSALSR